MAPKPAAPQEHSGDKNSGKAPSPELQVQPKVEERPQEQPAAISERKESSSDRQRLPKGFGEESSDEEKPTAVPVKDDDQVKQEESEDEKYEQEYDEPESDTKKGLSASPA